MVWFYQMKETFRDKSRDELAGSLKSLDIRADLAERGRVEEKIENSWYQRSLGIIDVPEGLVRWINILKRDAGKNSPPLWWIVLCIPDKRPVPDHHVVDIKTIRKKSFPLVGKVVDVVWEGDDHHTRLAEVLSNDETVKDLAKKIGNLVVRNYAKEFEGWTLQVDRRFEPTNQDWATIQKIAGYVLSSPRMF
jgi:hypothetical protein